ALGKRGIAMLGNEVEVDFNVQTLVVGELLNGLTKYRNEVIDFLGRPRCMLGAVGQVGTYGLGECAEQGSGTAQAVPLAQTFQAVFDLISGE
ncbi:MAG: hypothetical protein ACRDTF_15520, partial [Pseudonocardiaceae bacterium]